VTRLSFAPNFRMRVAARRSISCAVSNIAVLWAAISRGSSSACTDTAFGALIVKSYRLRAVASFSIRFFSVPFHKPVTIHILTLPQKLTRRWVETLADGIELLHRDGTLEPKQLGASAHPLPDDCFARTVIVVIRQMMGGICLASGHGFHRQQISAILPKKPKNANSYWSKLPPLHF
jgi:hypothetical protein